jgi:hypothetical protein
VKSEFKKGRLKTTPKEPTFPALYRDVSDGSVVLFTDDETGTVVYSGSSKDEIGFYCRYWMSCTFPRYWERLGPEDSVLLKGGDL